MATIHDVARAAGLSPATVSRVISGRGYVSAASRAQVLRAADALQYVPNRMARGLKTRRSGLVALLVPEIVNSFYTTISRGVEDIANAHGLHVILGNTDESEAKERAYVELMVATQVDGVIIAPAGRTADSLRSLLDAAVPTVLVDRSMDAFPADVVRADSVAGADALASHLASLGHRRIALINGHLDTSVAREREAGFRAGLEKHELEVEEGLLSSGTWFVADAEARTGSLLDQDDPPSAIVATNNFMAIGALRALRTRGLRVPDDIALVCFDDLEDAAEIDPFLTVLAQPAYTMGTMAMRLLLERIEGSFGGDPREIVLAPRLLVRRSCGAGDRVTAEMRGNGALAGNGSSCSRIGPAAQRVAGR